MRKLLLISFLLGSFYVGFSQTDGFSAKDNLKKFLAQKNKGELKKLQKGDKALSQAKATYAEADKYGASINKLKAQKASAAKSDAKKITKKIKKLQLKQAQKSIAASKSFSQASKIYFYVYKNNFKFARDRVSSDEAKIDEGKKLEAEANTLYKKAQTKRHQSLRIPKETDAYKILADADKLEQDAIDKQLKAYGLYLGWYAQEPNKEEIAVDNTKENPIDNSQTENPVDNSTVSPFIAPKEENNNTNVEEKNTKVDENLPDFTETKTNQAETNDYSTNLPDETETKAQVDIFFKIQVAASQIPLTLSKLRSIYNYSLYNNEYENGYYKYSIGKFKTYAEAERFKQKMNTQGVFIVAYKNGRKVNVVEADPSLKKKQNNHSISRVTPAEYGSSFRIQISATRVPVSENQLRKMNPSDLNIKINKVAGWYKYTVGSFKSYSQAERYRKSHNIKGFTVHYVNGKEIK